MWSGNQPNNIGGVQHCGVVDRESNYRMADEACDGYNAYVCDIRKYTSCSSKLPQFDSAFTKKAKSTWLQKNTSTLIQVYFKMGMKAISKVKSLLLVPLKAFVCHS